MKYCESVDDYLQLFEVAPGKALIVGSNTYGDKPPRQRLYEDALGIDAVDGDGVDLIHNLEQPLDMTFSHVDCCSVMEHCERPWLMAENIEACLEEGGTILFLAPFAWRIHAYPSDFWRFSVDALPILFPNIDWLDRSYIANRKIYKSPPKLEAGDLKGIQRTEVIAFGVKCSDS